MDQFPFEQKVLVILQLAALATLCVKLRQNGLYRIYNFFYIYLLLEVTQGVALSFVVPFNSLLYRDVYVVSEIVVLCSYVFVVLELYSIILRDLEGIASIAKRYIKITMAFAIGLSLLPLKIEKTPTALTDYLFLFERPLMSSLFVFILLLAAFLVYYPIPIGRNVTIYLIGYAVFFMGQTVSILFFNNLGRVSNRWLSGAMMSISVLCLIFWNLGLSLRGEQKLVVTGYHWGPDQERKLLAQLEAINASLLRSSKKINANEKRSL